MCKGSAGCAGAGSEHLSSRESEFINTRGRRGISQQRYTMIDDDRLIDLVQYVELKRRLKRQFFECVEMRRHGWSAELKQDKCSPFDFRYPISSSGAALVQGKCQEL